MGNVVDLIHGFLNVYLNKGSCVVVFVHFHLELLTVVVLAMLLDLLSCVYCILIIYNPRWYVSYGCNFHHCQCCKKAC